MDDHWKTVTLLAKASINDAIQVINKSGLRVALIIDDNGKLIGTITDGDIRRALIAQTDLSGYVTLIMNTSPKVALAHAPKSKLLALLKKDQLISIPVVNNQGVLIDLVSLHSLLDTNKYENPVFLMAGGFGTRLRPLTNNCPKPMLKVGDTPILEKILVNFIKAGFYQFYISTHYMPHVIEQHFGDGSKWGVNIHYVHEDSPLGTGGALGLLPENLPDLPIIMMNGDVLTQVDFEELLSYHNEQGALCTMCVSEHEYKVPYGVIETQGQKIIKMVEKPTQKYFINAGIYVVMPELISRVSVNQVVDMPTLIEKEINDNQYVSMYPLFDYWKDIGQIHDYDQANLDVENGTHQL